MQGRPRSVAFSTNSQSRLAAVVVDGVLGLPRQACQNKLCPCMSVVTESDVLIEVKGPIKATATA